MEFPCTVTVLPPVVTGSAIVMLITLNRPGIAGGIFV